MILIGIGRDTSGLVLLLGSIAALAAVFVYFKQTRKKELEEHKNTLDQETKDRSDES